MVGVLGALARSGEMTANRDAIADGPARAGGKCVQQKGSEEIVAKTGLDTQKTAGEIKE